jgi:predicted N-acetyltransferase YhbS
VPPPAADPPPPAADPPPPPATCLPERLAPGHDASGLSCGNDALGGWLRDHALTAQDKGVAVTYVWLDGSRVVAYFAISPTLVESQLLARGAATGLIVVPAYLLGKLALDRSLHGRGLGERLLTQALARVARVTAEGGGRLLVVDAIDDAAAFYAHFGFIPIPGTTRLYMKLSTIRRAMGG